MKWLVDIACVNSYIDILIILPFLIFLSVIPMMLKLKSKTDKIEKGHNDDLKEKQYYVDHDKIIFMK